MDYDSDFQDGTSKTSLGSVHYRYHSGSRDTLVMIHGLGGTAHTWKRLVEILPDDIEVYLLDLLGHGQSESPQIDYTIENMSQSIDEFLISMNLHNFVLVGHSYGGWVSAYYAAWHKVRGLVLEDSAGLFDRADPKKIENFKKDAIEQAKRTGTTKEYVIASILDNELKHPEERLDGDILSKIDSPTLIIWGGRDLLLSPEAGKILHQKIKNSRLDIIRDAGHLPHLTNTQEFMEVLLDFVTSNA